MSGIMRHIPTKTRYLEMRSPPPPSPEASPEIQVRRVPSPSLQDYRRLYDGVGHDFNWIDRILMPVYLKAGFVLYDEKVIQQVVADRE
jgi:hypothetical protein